MIEFIGWHLPGGCVPPGPREEDTAGARRMPWHGKPTKGAASCDKPRGGANGLRSGDSRMGEPSRGHALLPAPEPIRCEEATGGTETSKYPEERKSTETPGVAASETGLSPNPRTCKRQGVAARGLRGEPSREPALSGGVTKPHGSGTAWEGRPQRVRAPYADPCGLRGASPSRAGHVKPGPKQGGPPSKAEHSPMTDSEPVP